MSWEDYIDGKEETTTTNDDSGFQRIPFHNRFGWKDKTTGKGELIMYLHPTGGQPVPRIGTEMPEVVRYKRDGEDRSFLKFRSFFLSPDQDERIVARSWSSVTKGDGIDENPRLRQRPLDPGIWLTKLVRDAIEDGRIGVNDPVFKWTGTRKADQSTYDIVWEAKFVAGLEKGDGKNFGKSLKPKYKSLIQMVDYDEQDKGLQVMELSGDFHSKMPPQSYVRKRELGYINAAILKDRDDLKDEDLDPSLALPSNSRHPFVLKYNKDAGFNCYTFESLRTHAARGKYRGKVLQRTAEIEAALDREPYDLTTEVTPSRTWCDKYKLAMLEGAASEIVTEMVAEAFRPWEEALAKADGGQVTDGDDLVNHTKVVCNNCSNETTVFEDDEDPHCDFCGEDPRESPMFDETVI